MKLKILLLSLFMQVDSLARVLEVWGLEVIKIMKTLLTILLTFVLANNAYAYFYERLAESLSFTSPKECSNMLNTMPNKEISSSLVSKYGECINSHLSKITGTPVDGKVKFLSAPGYIGMNLNIEIEQVGGQVGGGLIFRPKSLAPLLSHLTDADNPFEWYASSEDGYNFIYASRFLSLRRRGLFFIY